MRGSSPALRRLSASAIGIPTRFWRAMNVRLRWPRWTTRRLMVLVAVVALLIWAARVVPNMIDRAITGWQRAEAHAGHESLYRDKARRSLARARAVREEFDRLLSDEGSADLLTERYFEAGWDFEVVNAQYYDAMITYHESMKQKHLQARWFPWTSVPPDTAPPRDPFSLSRYEYVESQGRQVAVTPDNSEYMLETSGYIEGGISVAFTPDSRALAVGCRDQTIRLLELPSKKVLARFVLPEGDAQSMVFSPDGTTLLAAGGNHPVWRWDLATGRAPRALPWIDQSPGQPGRSLMAGVLACSPDGGTIAIAGGDYLGTSTTELYSIRLLDARTGERKWENEGSGHWARSPVFSPDGGTLACANGAAMLLDARTGQLNKTLKPLIGYVMAVAFSPDGRILAGAGSNTVPMGGFNGSGRVTLWDVSTGSILRTLEGPTGRAQTVAFSPDGRTIAAGGTGPQRDRRHRVSRLRATGPASEVRLWEVETGRPVWTAEGESDAAYTLAFSPDGSSLAYCDLDYVYLIDAKAGRLRQIIMETNVRYLPLRSRN
jgi:WD40 repeat protein